MSPQIERILVGVSGQSGKVLAAAAEIAMRARATLELVSVFRPPAPSGLYRLSAAELARAARAAAADRRISLERLAKPLRMRGLGVTCHVEQNGSAADGLLDCIERERPQLVAIEAHHHHAIARLLLSQTDFHLIRECPVPLLIVKNPPRASRSVILAALDPRQTNGKPASLDAEILATAQLYAGVLEGPLHAAHVCAPLLGFVGDPMFAPVAVPVSVPEESAYVAQVRRNFKKFCVCHAVKPRNVHLRTGDPAVALPKIARACKARMVVMGAVARGRLTRALIGNTAERVLDAMPCDVLVVKSARARRGRSGDLKAA